MSNVTLYDSVQGTYASMSGADVVCTMSVPVLSSDGHSYVFKSIPFGTLQTLSISTHRDVYPVRALGSINPRGKCRSGRTISGTMVFTLFDHDAVFEAASLIASTQGADVATSIYDNLLADELPYFDIIINMANEYGSMANMAVYGVTVLDMGQVMSIDNIVTEQTMSYMAQGLRKLHSGSFTSGGPKDPKPTVVPTTQGVTSNYWV